MLVHVVLNKAGSGGRDPVRRWNAKGPPLPLDPLPSAHTIWSQIHVITGNTSAGREAHSECRSVVARMPSFGRCCANGMHVQSCWEWADKRQCLKTKCTREDCHTPIYNKAFGAKPSWDQWVGGNILQAPHVYSFCSLWHHCAAAMKALIVLQTYDVLISLQSKLKPTVKLSLLCSCTPLNHEKIPSTTHDACAAAHTSFLYVHTMLNIQPMRSHKAVRCQRSDAAACKREGCVDSQTDDAWGIGHDWFATHCSLRIL